MIFSSKTIKKINLRKKRIEKTERDVVNFNENLHTAITSILEKYLYNFGLENSQIELKSPLQANLFQELSGFIDFIVTIFVLDRTK